MIQDEIAELIKKGESESIEFKENFDKEAIETAVAFANTKGGINQISQSTEPRLIPEIEQNEIEGKSVVLIRIKEFPIKPVSVRGRYIRKANATGRRTIVDGDTPLKALEKLELIKDGKPTFAAIILFGKAPQVKLLQATVHCGRFKQETVIIDDKLIGGTAIEQIGLTGKGTEYILKGVKGVRKGSERGQTHHERLTNASNDEQSGS